MGNVDAFDFQTTGFNIMHRIGLGYPASPTLTQSLPCDLEQIPLLVTSERNTWYSPVPIGEGLFEEESLFVNVPFDMAGWVKNQYVMCNRGDGFDKLWKSHPEEEIFPDE